MKKYLLFDIDGTLINTGGAGLKAMKTAVSQVLGREDLLTGYSFAGKTDAQIMKDMARAAGQDSRADEISADLKSEYIAHLKQNLKTSDNFKIYPGASELLAHYHSREDFELALLTGNFETGAELKLEHAGLWHFFKWGAFGNISEERIHLAEHALETITQKEESLVPKNIFIIGDTTNDIRCGRAINATTVAFSAGFEPEEKLKACEPDYLVSDFGKMYDIFGS